MRSKTNQACSTSCQQSTRRELLVIVRWSGGQQRTPESIVSEVAGLHLRYARDCAPRVSGCQATAA
jgi:hypothetical protein